MGFLMDLVAGDAREILLEVGLEDWPGLSDRSRFPAHISLGGGMDPGWLDLFAQAAREATDSDAPGSFSYAACPLESRLQTRLASIGDRTVERVHPHWIDAVARLPEDQVDRIAARWIDLIDCELCLVDPEEKPMLRQVAGDLIDFCRPAGCLDELDEHAVAALRVNEGNRTLTTLARSGVDQGQAGGSQTVQGSLDVGHLETHVMKPLTLGLEEARRTGCLVRGLDELDLRVAHRQEADRDVVVFHVQHGLDLQPEPIPIKAKRSFEVPDDDGNVVDPADAYAVGKGRFELLHDSPGTGDTEARPDRRSRPAPVGPAEAAAAMVRNRRARAPDDPNASTNRPARSTAATRKTRSAADTGSC